MSEPGNVRVSLRITQFIICQLSGIAGDLRRYPLYCVPQLNGSACSACTGAAAGACYPAGDWRIGVASHAPAGVGRRGFNGRRRD